MREAAEADDTVSAARASPNVGRIALAVTLLPLVVSAVVLIVFVRGDYMPMSDHALTEMHVRDIGHHPVLIGLFSRDDWSHPGPMLFYVLAPFYWLSRDSSIALSLGALAINGACIAGMYAIAKRRGGTALALCTLLASSLLMRTLGAQFMRDPWNNYVTVLPFALLVLVVWTMACGDLWALPLAVLVASFLAQTHVGFVVLALPLLGVGVIWLVVTVLRSDRSAVSGAQLLKVGAGSTVLALVLWLPVIVDAVENNPSNLDRLTRWFQDAHDGIHTLAQGWHVVTGQFGGFPEWASWNRAPLLFSAESSFLYSSPFPWVLLLVAVATYAFWRSRQADGLRLVGMLAITFVLGVLAVARTVGLVFEYRLRWTWVLGMLGFVVVAWSGWLALTRWRPGLSRRILVPLALVAVALCSTVNVVTSAWLGTPQAADDKVLATLLPGVLHTLEATPGSKQGAVIVDDGRFEFSAWYSRSLVLQLERRGYDTRMPPNRGLIIGEHRQYDGGPVAAHLVVARDAEIAQRDQDPSLRKIAEWSSVTDEQQFAYQQDVAALDADLAAGRMSVPEHATAMARIDLANEDPAIAWAVAVYLADPSVPPTS